MKVEQLRELLSKWNLLLEVSAETKVSVENEWNKMRERSNNGIRSSSVG